MNSPDTQAPTPDTPNGRHHLADTPAENTSPPEVEQRRGELIAALSDDVPVYRVLWLLARGMNLAWCLRDLAQAAAVKRAVAIGLVVGPVDELIAYQLTDAGLARIREWYFGIRHHCDEPGFGAIWRAVTAY